MNNRWTRVQNYLGIAFIGAGLCWGIAQQISVHAQQPSAPSTVSAGSATSDTLRLQGGNLQPRRLSGSLGESVNRWAAATTKAEWLGYSVAQVKGDRSICCPHWGENKSTICDACKLETANHGVSISSEKPANTKVNLEGPGELAVLYRAESGKLSQIRVLSLDCVADAGGLSVIWLDGVKATDSVALLEKFVRGANMESASSEKIAESALTAIALHADSSADRALQSFVASTEPVSLRREAAFWLGEARGPSGLQILQKMAQSDPSPDVREQVAFALSISKEPGALTELIRMAHDDQIPGVRSQALFWLGQKAGEKASKAITSAIDADPDTEVKKKAVFALSQMPPDEGVLKLIQVAQTNHNPAVRKEAMFWLGQSGDPQALAFFEKVLTQ